MLEHSILQSKSPSSHKGEYHSHDHLTVLLSQRTQIPYRRNTVSFPPLHKIVIYQTTVFVLEDFIHAPNVNLCVQ